VHPVHGSTVDHAEGVSPDLISDVDQRSNDSGRTQARVAAGFAGERRRAAGDSSARP
jgi:hypothetical protein